MFILRKVSRTMSRWRFGEANTENMSSEKGIKIYKYTDQQTKAWSELSVKQNVRKVDPLPNSTSISEDKIRFVCLSDTHSKIEAVPDIVPAGDVLLHAGDFSNVGRFHEVVAFNEFLGKLPHTVKIVIAGNHDLTLDDNLVENDPEHLRDFGVSVDDVKKKLQDYGITSVKDLLTNCVYLEDTGIDVCGIQVYGSPWQPVFCDWGFNLPRGEQCLKKWNLIPENTDILITHGPPIGHGDACFDGNRAGCVELLSTIQQRVKPSYHIFGHIHEGHGITTDGHTKYINASTCTLRYKPQNPPIVFDYPIPEGHSKEELLNVLPQRIIRHYKTGEITVSKNE